MSKFVSINGGKVGADFSPYIIAELSANHLRDFERAIAIMEAAKKAGADAIKLQTYTADTMTIDHDGEGFVIDGNTLWDGKKLHDLYEEAHTPWEWHEALFNKGRELGITVFSTPFDISSLEFLGKFDPPAYKIASFEMTDLPLVRKTAATGKPLIMSTGMATKEEVSESVAAARDAGCKELVLLHCVSGYPTPPEDSNLLTIPDLASSFDAVIGLSDHSLGVAVPTAAVALGACVIEKHFTLSRADGGPDAAFSLEPDELRELVENSLVVWKARGSANYEIKESEKSLIAFRRSLYVVKDIEAGELLSEDNIRSIRPGYGLSPKFLTDIIGKHAKKDLKRGAPLNWEVID